MSSENQVNKIIIIFALAIIFLIILSYIPGGTDIFGYKTKPVDLFIDIKPDSLISSDYNIKTFNEKGPAFLQAGLKNKLAVNLK